MSVCVVILVGVALFTFTPAHAAIGSAGEVVNSKVDRTIDISKQVVKLSLNIAVLNKGAAPLKEYVVHLGDAEHEKALSYLEAFVVPNQGSKTRHPLTVERARDPNGMLAFKLQLDPIHRPASSKSVNIELEAGFSHLLSAYPSEILQADRQLLVYTDRIYLPTQYETTTQVTRVLLPSATGLESYSKLKPTSQSDRSITYGPYEKIAATIDTPVTAEQVLRIHNENNSPLLVTRNLERSIQVSHWAAAISIEEIIDVEHVGAKLKGAFSRYEFQRDASLPSACIKGWQTRLPALAQDVYYRDEIGNISTSNARQARDSVVLEIRPRFPLFGGWKTQYILGYVLPTTNNLYMMDGGELGTNRYKLRIPFVDHSYDNMIIDRATVKIILPEGATNFDLVLPYDVKKEKQEIFYSYLDTVGRPVIVLSKTNLVDWHIQDIEIIYSFKPIYLLQEPLLVTGSIFALCLMVVGLVRTKVSLDG